MYHDTVRMLATYVIAAMVLVGSFVLIYQGRGDSAQAWLAVGAVLGYLFRDSGGHAATLLSERIQNAAANNQPTVVNAAPPSTINVNGDVTDGDREG